MRDMIFNDLSVQTPVASIHEVLSVCQRWITLGFAMPHATGAI